jgi:hypothetical protein
MVKETSAGLMETNLWDNIKMIKNMVMEISLLQMEPILSKDFSLTMKSKTSE